MKRILFYITNFPGYGGIEKVTAYIANALCKQNYDITILSFHNGAQELLQSLDKSIHCIFVPDQKQYICEVNQSFINELFNSYTFDRIIYQDCYSPIHQLLLQANISLMQKLIVVEHNSPNCQLINYQNHWRNLYWTKPKDIIRKLAYPYKRMKIYHKISTRHRKLLQIANKYILLSDKFLPEIHYLVGNKFDDKILSIPNPVTLPLIAPDTSFKKKKNIVFIGRLVEDKGINYLLQIWSKIECMTSDWTLFIIGDGQLKYRIEEFIQNNKLRKIQLLGTKVDVSPYLEEASILMMTSIFEGFPLVLFEAMSRGCVPVAFNSFAALTDIIDNGINGYIIPTYKTTDYSNKLKRIMENPKLLSDFSKEAIVKAGEYSIEKIIEKWKMLL